MKKTLLSVMAVAAFGLMSATAYASACTNGPLSGYEAAGFSCTIGALTFSNFSQNPGPPPAVGVVVVTGAESGLVFNPGFSAIAGQTLDVDILFTVSAASAIINDIVLEADSSTTGNGTTNVTEEYCLGGASVLTCPTTDHTIFLSNANGPTTITFPGVSTIGISKDINATGNTGTASISQVFNGFSTTVPEPLTVSLTGFGLAALAFRRWRASKQG